MSGSEGGAGTGQPDIQNTRSPSPTRIFAHRAIMGGAADLPQRSSSPLKRRAEEDPELNVSRSEDDDIRVVLATNDTETLPDRGDETKDVIQPQPSSSPDNISEVRDKFGVDIENMSAGVPSIDQQIASVTRMCEEFESQPPASGTKAYMVSNKWLARVQARGSTAKASNKEDLEGDIGPIDNSDIIQEILKDQEGSQFPRLTPGVGQHNMTYFPEDAWEYMTNLHGIKPGQVPIVRKMLNTNAIDPTGIPNFQYELYPVVFLVHRLWAANSPIPVPQILKATNPSPPIFIVSRGDNYMEFLKKVKQAASIELSQSVRVWRIPRDLQNVKSIASSLVNESSPPASRASTPVIPDLPSRPQDSWTKLLVDVASFLALEKKVDRIAIETQFKDQTNNPNYNGHSTIDMVGLGGDQALVLDEAISGDNYVSNFVAKASKYNSTSISVTNTNGGPSQSAIVKISDSGRSSPAPSGPITRGRSQKSGRTIGMVGLGNLGNTCYMNSALQCVRSVEELTKYFLSGEAEKELNTDNPLGNNGDVARVYHSLLEEIYRNPAPTSVTPRQFKNTIGRYAPSFSGYGQQDSQEFLGFLLDGLQEDLSRVKKKPYIEKPDSTDDMVENPEAIREMAAKVWDITKKRDDSVIADLFTGMYKSTLVCPVCDKVSITFDPFNNLTLQLPIESTWNHDVYYFPLNDAPMRISVDMDKQASIKALKEYIGKRVGVPANRLFVAEEWKSRFYKYFDDMKPASEEISPNDQVAVYELEDVPTNWPAPKKTSKKKPKSMLNFSSNDSEEDDVPNWDSPMADRMLVPVYQRQPNTSDSRFNRKAWQHAPVPCFIVLTPSEARSEEAIRRKVLEKVATFTTRGDFLTDDEEDNTSDVVDPDLVVTTASDADSSGDGKIVATSVDGEDDVVNIAMKDPDTTHESTETASVPGKVVDNEIRLSRKRKFPSRRPKWINPDVPMNPEFKTMFELSYFSGTKEIVPLGWNVVDEDKNHPKLSSRVPVEQRISEDDDLYDAISDGGLDQSEDGSDEKDGDTVPLTRMNEESSSDDDDDDELAPNNNLTRAIPVRAIVPKSGIRVGYTRRRNAGPRTYTKKGAQPAKLSNHSGLRTQETPDDGPLIRLGEGLIVDWTTGAHEAFFGGTDGDNGSRGLPTYTHIELMDDPELDAKRKTRNSRRKQGLTLDECLDEFGKEEILSEMDTWYCPRCKEHRRASKKFELWKTPDILVMHLKRFSSGAYRRDKLDVLVDFPIEGLDLTSRVVENEVGKREVYDLFAVDDHWGGLGGGHYTAFAKSFVDQDWYEYNDSSVTKQKDTSRIVSSGAYLLFYRRRSDNPLGGPRFKEIINRYDNPPDTSEDESAESGEDQRLGADSSQRGSSSALIGAGVTRLQGAGSGGVPTTRNLPSDNGILGETGKTINPALVENPPEYQGPLQQDYSTQTLSNDAERNQGLEVDEGIDMTDSYDDIGNIRRPSNPLLGRWSFNALNLPNSTSKSMNSSVAGSDVDIADASDIVQHDSSASEGSIAGRLADFDNAEPEAGEWEEPMAVPDMVDDHMGSYIQDALLRNMEVRPIANRSAEEEETAEIYIEDSESLKMD